MIRIIEDLLCKLNQYSVTNKFNSITISLSRSLILTATIHFDGTEDSKEISIGATSII